MCIFAVITKEMEKRYKDKVIEVPLNDYLMVRNELGVLTVIEDEYETSKLSVMKDIEFTPGQIETYYKYALENDVFKKYDYRDLGKITSDIKQPKFSDLVAMYGFMYGTGAWEGNAEYLYDKGISLD